MQHGIDALPGMTILSACLETVSLRYLWQLCNWNPWIHQCSIICYIDID
jgi:hypothetical protein